MTTTHHPTIRDALPIEFVLASAYALLIILGTIQPETLLGAAAEGWIDFTAPAVQVLFTPATLQDGLLEGVPLDAIGVYRHILSACFLVACWCFLRSRQHWRHWGERVRGPLSATTGRPGSRRRVARLGYRRMLLGLVAVIFLALFAESQIPAIADYLFGTSWTYIRTPLPTAFAYSFACHAAALRVSLSKPR